MTVPNASEMEALERLVDAHGLAEVLIALDVICGDKAAHIRASYDDARTARIWERAGWQMRNASTAGSVRSVSPL